MYWPICVELCVELYLNSVYGPDGIMTLTIPLLSFLICTVGIIDGSPPVGNKFSPSSYSSRPYSLLILIVALFPSIRYSLGDMA